MQVSLAFFCLLLSELSSPALRADVFLAGFFSYEAASFTFECLYDKQTFDLVSAARDQGRCAERAPPTCTSVLTRRAKPETAYSRALKARQWSREKLATKLLASE
jgi:hypothetical protein